MAFKELCDKRKYPQSISDRYKRLDGLRAAQQGTIFNVLRHSFDEEESAPGTDIPVRERRPSIYYNIFKLLVDNTSSLTFGESHAPALRVDIDPAEDPDRSSEVHTALESLMEELRLDRVMLRAMNLGAPGSVMLVLRALPDKYPWVELIEGQFCKPYYDPEDPRVLKRIDQIYPCTAEELDLAGYEGTFDRSKTYWIKVTYDIHGKTASLPISQTDFERIGTVVNGEKIVWRFDEERSYANPFDFMPCIWIKNIDTTNSVDGAPTVPVEVIDIAIEISYALSMSTRGYAYTADPVMMVKAGTMRTTIPLAGSMGGDDGQGANFTRSPRRRLMLSADGDASMLEISAQGLKASDEHVSLLREYALELASGMKSESKDTGGTQSGKAFDKMYLALVWLVEKLRCTYGDCAYLDLIKMILKGCEAGILSIDGVDTSVLDSTMRLRCAWPEWDTPVGGDMQAEMNALAIAVGSTATLPVPIITVEQAATKAASLLRLGDRNRAAAQVIRAHTDNPPLTAREHADIQAKAKTDTAEIGAEARAKQVANKPVAK